MATDDHDPLLALRSSRLRVTIVSFTRLGGIWLMYKSIKRWLLLLLRRLFMTVVRLSSPLPASLRFEWLEESSIQTPVMATGGLGDMMAAERFTASPLYVSVTTRRTLFLCEIEADVSHFSNCLQAYQGPRGKPAILAWFEKISNQQFGVPALIAEHRDDRVRSRCHGGITILHRTQSRFVAGRLIRYLYYLAALGVNLFIAFDH